MGFPEYIKSELWFNPFITIDKRTLFYLNWYKHGIRYISDIIGEDGFILTDLNLKVKYKIEFTFLEYYGLRHAIPRSWKSILIEEACNDCAVTPRTFNYKLSSKDIYWNLQGAPGESKQALKWINEFNIDPQDWGAICKLPFQSTFETKIQSFQYSILYRFVPYKKRLRMMQLVDSDLCDYCTGVDTIIHRFVTCPIIKQFWSDFSNWWKICGPNGIGPSGKDVILGLYVQSNYALNNCILVAKHFIHKIKCNKGLIYFRIFIGQLKQHIAIEEYTLLKNKNEHIFKERWEHVRLV